MPKPITEFKRNQVKDLYLEGLSIRDISEKANMSIKSVIRIIAKITHTTRWSKSEIDTLIKSWSSVPKGKFVSSIEFSDLCKSLNRSPTSVLRMVNNIGLNDKGTNGKYIEIDHENIDDIPLKRPPTVYTNSRSPYGIADEIHTGDRIFIEQCKY